MKPCYLPFSPVSCGGRTRTHVDSRVYPHAHVAEFSAARLRTLQALHRRGPIVAPALVGDDDFVAALAGLLLARGLYHYLQGQLQLQSMVGGQEVVAIYDTQVVGSLPVCIHVGRRECNDARAGAAVQRVPAEAHAPGQPHAHRRTSRPSKRETFLLNPKP